MPWGPIRVRGPYALGSYQGRGPLCPGGLNIPTSFWRASDSWPLDPWSAHLKSLKVAWYELWTASALLLGSSPPPPPPLPPPLSVDWATIGPISCNLSVSTDCAYVHSMVSYLLMSRSMSSMSRYNHINEIQKDIRKGNNKRIKKYEKIKTKDNEIRKKRYWQQQKFHRIYCNFLFIGTGDLISTSNVIYTQNILYYKGR